MKPKDQKFEAALRDLEVTANSFATRLARIADVRVEYVTQIREMSQSLRAAVESGELSAMRGAEIAHQMRNEIMEMQRARDFDMGKTLARRMKTKGITLEEAIARSIKKLKLEGKPFNKLPGTQQRQVLLEVIDSSGRSRPAVTRAIPRFRWAARGLWLATFAIAAYNIGTAENPWWQSGREAANITGGFAGGFAGGAAMGAAGGIWAGPVGIAIGVVVGGILGAVLSDHVYVEAAGTSDPVTRPFISRFTSLWKGVDEKGMATALTREHRSNLSFVHRVFLSLNQDYNADADDVALEYVNLVRKEPGFGTMVRGNSSLRKILIQVMKEGWTSGEEQQAIQYLQS